MREDLEKFIATILAIDKGIKENYDDLSKIKPTNFFEYEATKVLLRLVSNQERITAILKIMHRGMEE